MAFMQNDAVRPTGSDRRVDGVITQSGQPGVISIDDADVVPGSNFDAPQMNWSFEESLDHDSELPIDLPQSNPEALPGWDQAANFPNAIPLNGAELFQSAYDEPWPDNNSTGFEPLVRHYWDNGNLTDSAIDPANNATFDLLGFFGIPGSRNNTTSFGNMPFPGSAIFNTLSWKPPLSFDGGDPINTALEDQPSSLIRLNDTRVTALEVVDISKQLEWRPTISRPTFPHVGTRPTPSPPIIPLTPETDADLIKILCGYPQMMLQSGGNYPPFVHHKIYGCEKGDVLKPLANAFCCVSALNAALPSGEAFVHALLTAERERLVRSFVRNLFPSTYPNPALCAQSLSLPPRGTERTLTLVASQSLLKSSETDTLAVIHAMCVYQILGFFSASNAAAARAAALQQPFFLKVPSHLPPSPFIVFPSNPPRWPAPSPPPTCRTSSPPPPSLLPRRRNPRGADGSSQKQCAAPSSSSTPSTRSPAGRGRRTRSSSRASTTTCSRTYRCRRRRRSGRPIRRWSGRRRWRGRGGGIRLAGWCVRDRGGMGAAGCRSSRGWC